MPLTCGAATVCRVLACLAIAGVTCKPARAGGFAVLAADTSLSDSLGSEVVFDLRVVNTSGRELTIAMVRTLNDLPESWQSSLCIDLCFSPLIDSVATTADFGSSPLRMGDTADVSVHVFPLVHPGLGTVRVALLDATNPADRQEFRFTTTAVATAVGPGSVLPQECMLAQNYPNPWNPSTTIRYRLSREGHVSLRLFDTLGREMRVLVEEHQQAGEHAVGLEGTGLASGMYIYRLVSEAGAQTRTMILVR